MSEQCATCKCFSRMANGFVCRFNPPTLVTIQGTDELGNQGLIVQGHHVPVKADGWCKQYEAGQRVAIASALPKLANGVH